MPSPADVSLTSANLIASKPQARERARVPQDWERRFYMPTSKELTIRMENRPGTLGNLCKALADQKVNILAFQSVPVEGNSSVRLIVDNHTAAKKVLDAERLSYTDTEVAQAKLANRPGELAHAAS